MNNRKTHKRMGSRLLAILCATLLVATMLPISVAADGGGLYDGWYALTDGITMDANSGAITLDGMSAAQHLYLNHENGSAENASRFSKDSLTDFVIEFDFAVTDYTNKADVDAGNAGAGNGALSLSLMALDGSRLDYECVTARVDYANAGIMWRGYSTINNPYEASWGYASGISQWHWILNYADTKHAKITKSDNTITLDVNNGSIVQTATLPSDIGLPAGGYVGLLVEGAKVTVANMVVSAGAEKETFFSGNVTGDVHQGWWYAPLTGADNAILNADNSLTINAMNGTEALFLNHDGGNNTALFGKDALTDFVIEFDFTVLDYVNKALVEDGTGANLGAGNGALSLSLMALSGDYLHYEAVTARVDYQNAGIMWRGYSSIANPYEGNYSYASGISQWHWLFNNGEARHAKITKSGNTITLDVANGYVVQSATLPSDISLPAAGYVGFLLEYASVNFRNVKVTNTTTGASQEFFHVHAWNTPTCTQPWTCSTCGTQTGEAAGHSFADGVCTVCGEADPDYSTCEHEYFYACDAHCMNCGELTNPDAAHSLTHVEAVEPTCYENGNKEYWTCAYCTGCWDNENATGMPLNMKTVVELAKHDNLVHMEAVEPGCHYEGNIEYWVCYDCETVWQDAALTQITNIKNVIRPALGGEVIHVEAKDATCYENGNIEYWYCENCEQVWQDEALTQLTNIKNVVVPVAHDNLVHMEAVEPGCHYEGNIEYWICYDCETVWQDEDQTQITNIKNVVRPALGGDVIHVAAKDATCYEEGNIEYWYCETCEKVWQDEALTQLTNFKNVVVPVTHDNLVHVEAVEPGCHYEGNIEHWICYDCETVWQDEALTQITNIKNVVRPALGGEVIHVEAVDATYEQNGNIEYWYCEICEQVWQDEALTQLTNIKNVIRPALEGFVTKGTKTYYYRNGAALKGLQKTKGDFYYFSTGDGNMKKDCDIFVSANDLGLARGAYKVAADGKIQLAKNGLIVIGEKTYYFVNDEMQYGLQKIEDDFYYFHDKAGYMYAGISIWVSANDKGLERGRYNVAEDGKIQVVKNGWLVANGKTYYYVDDVALTGAQEIDGNYYYFSTGDGNMKKDGAIIWVPADNDGGVPYGKYIAGADGVLTLA